MIVLGLSGLPHAQDHLPRTPSEQGSTGEKGTDA